MKLNHLLLETVQDQLSKLSAKYDISSEILASYLRSVAGPYWKWLLTRAYNDDIELRDLTGMSDDLAHQELKDVFDQFAEVYHRLPERDINQYKTFEDLKTAIAPYLGIKSSKKTHKIASLPGVEIVRKDNPYITVRVTDVDSLKTLGEGTTWCTREGYGGESAQGYLDRFGELFIVLQNGRPVMQYTPDYSQIKDINNVTIEYTGGSDTTAAKLLDLIPLPQLPKVESGELDQKAYRAVSRAIGYFGNVLNTYPTDKARMDKNPELPAYIEELGKLALLDRDLAIQYVQYVRRGAAWPQAEDKYYQDPSFAYSYAIYTGKRFAKGEAAILTRPIYILSYIKYIIRRQWPEAEPVLAKDPEFAVEYARLFFAPNRWPLGEKSIKTNAEFSYKYAIMIGQRFPEGEPVISKDPNYAIHYTMNVLNGGMHDLLLLPRRQRSIDQSGNYIWDPGSYEKPARFPMGERVIAQNAAAAYKYAFYIIRGRWIEGEAAIQSAPSEWLKYQSELQSIKEAPPAGQ